jgi:RNA polymerase sigma-70 factor (ECF subfamily)
MRRDLIERAMAHDHEAFTELARLTIDKLYAIARLILRDEYRAEDAVQEALVACWRDIAALRDPERFEAWQRRLLVHACYREARKDNKRRRLELHIPEFDRGEPDASSIVADRDQIERVFRTLTPELRTLFVLRYYADLSLEETADALDLPVGTVKSRLSRGTRILRSQLDADERSSSLIEGRTA